MVVRISSPLMDQMYWLVKNTPKVEICGLLLGQEKRITAFIPCANIAANPEHSFEIDPKALFTQMRGERAGGMPCIGHYHSHPNGSPVPSRRDAEAALELGRLWLILTAADARLWRAAENGAVEERFDPVDLIIDDM